MMVITGYGVWLILNLSILYEKRRGDTAINFLTAYLVLRNFEVPPRNGHITNMIFSCSTFVLESSVENFKLSV